MSYHFRYPNHYHYQHHLLYQSPSSIIVHVATNAKKAYEADYWKGFFGWGDDGGYDRRRWC
jgi:hypothetical protein